MFFANWHLAECLANLWWMVFGELTRWRMFGELFLANWHFGGSLWNLLGMVLWLTAMLANLWRIFGKSLGNFFLRTDNLANLWRIYDEWLLANWQVGECLANCFWRTDTLANLWRIFCEWFLKRTKCWRTAGLLTAVAVQFNIYFVSNSPTTGLFFCGSSSVQHLVRFKFTDYAGLLTAVAVQFNT